MDILGLSCRNHKELLQGNEGIVLLTAMRARADDSVTVLCELDKPARLVCHGYSTLYVQHVGAVNQQKSLKSLFMKILRYMVFT